MKIVLYGAGQRGHRIYEFLESVGYADVITGFCDKQAKEIKYIKDKKVWLPEELEKTRDVIYCMTLGDEKKREEVQNELGRENCIEFSDLPDFIHADRVKFNRDYCAFYHVNNMDSYFERVESEEELDIFWSVNSEFYQMFQKLDALSIIELACGHGRHVSKYFDKANEITLVDILQKNIDICIKRFGENGKVKYYKNNGYDLKKLPSETYSALFSYDAMVHFELIDIYFYLKDIHRVLRGGGRALLHHSNYHEDYKAYFDNAPGSRSFMSKDIFAYLAYRTGFTILEQKVIDWSRPELDCITLIEKP